MTGPDKNIPGVGHNQFTPTPPSMSDPPSLSSSSTGIVVGSLTYTSITSTGVVAALAADQSVRFMGMGLAATASLTTQAIVGSLFGVAAGAAASAVAAQTIQAAALTTSIAARNQVEMGFNYGGAATAATAGVGAGLLVTVVCAGAHGACYATKCAMDALNTRYQKSVPSADYTDMDDIVLVTMKKED